MENIKKEHLVSAWFGLLLLTATGLIVGQSFGHASWMPILVSALIWVKGWLVGRYFLNVHEVHPYVAWVVRVFTAFAPAALLVTAALSR